jgi:hypothetical protein
MKLYTNPEPPFLIRLNIKKAKFKTEFITLCETTQMLKILLKPKT